METPEERHAVGLHQHHHRPDNEKPALWDRLGMTLSGICMIHCLVVPIILALIPLWPVGQALHAWMHPILAVVLVPTTLLAMRSAWKQHHQTSIVVHLAIGLAVILMAGVLGHAVPGAWTETLVTMVGSITLISGHWRNWRHCRSCAVHTHGHVEVRLKPIVGEFNHASTELHA